MKPQVLVRMVDDKEFFVVDEDSLASDILVAFKRMKNGPEQLEQLYRMLFLEHALRENTS